MLGVNVVAAETDAEARLLLTSVQQAFVNLRSGRPTRLPPPVEGFAERLGPQQAAMLDDVLACAAVGSPETVRGRLEQLVARTGADELILTSQIHDHRARVRCFEIAARVRDGIT
jgi:alkanesulfonate monooxygenase SsuD/methylene tetrahydromethanopterin reductase-like flavin-dependent oxidoreductase (luciferase family)